MEVNGILELLFPNQRKRSVRAAAFRVFTLLGVGVSQAWEFIGVVCGACTSPKA